MNILDSMVNAEIKCMITNLKTFYFSLKKKIYKLLIFYDVS